MPIKKNRKAYKIKVTEKWKTLERSLPLLEAQFLIAKNKKQFVVSTNTLFKDVFGINRPLSGKHSFLAFLYMYGEDVDSISNIMGLSGPNVRMLSGKLYSILDVSSRHDLQARILVYFLQKKEIVIAPSGIPIEKTLTFKELYDDLI